MSCPEFQLVFCQDVSASLSKKYPQLYQEGIKNVFFTWRVVAIWAFFSVYQSLILYNFAATSSASAQNSSGKMFGLWDVSTMAFTCVVVTVNLRLLMMCNTITKYHHITVGGSILAWFIFIFLYSGIMTAHDRQVSPSYLTGYIIVYYCSTIEFFYGLTCILYIFVAGECLLCHICLDEYILFLLYISSCSCGCTSRRLHLPRVMFRNTYRDTAVVCKSNYYYHHHHHHLLTCFNVRLHAVSKDGFPPMITRLFRKSTGMILKIEEQQNCWKSVTSLHRKRQEAMQ